LLININLNIRRQLFYSSLPAEAVAIAILKYASFHSWRCLINRKVESFKQCFYRNTVQCPKLGLQ